MSKENVEIVRACLDSAQRGDLETTLAYFSDDVVWLNRPPEVGPYHGREGVRGAIAGFAEYFDGYWFKAELCRAQVYSHPAEALEAAGLRE